MHAGTHKSLVKLLRHCRALDPEQLHREIEGFGYPTVHLQLHHLIDAEDWWVGVLQGRCEYVNTAAQHTTLRKLEAYRKRVAAGTLEYLERASTKKLNTAREMTVYGNKQRMVAPAQALVLVFTHAFHHFGQVAAMCRLLGHPAPPTGYPFTP
jgi:uncharacterized damage-inducible protein DinB